MQTNKTKQKTIADQTKTYLTTELEWIFGYLYLYLDIFYIYKTLIMFAIVL